MTVVTNNQTELNASRYIDPQQELVASAKLLADAANDALARAPSVTIDLRGLRSVSSSYFNMLLSLVASTSGNDAIKSRLHFRFLSSAQEQIFKLSFEAVLKSRGA
jgi:anti-anti-sigma regulatory factor